MGGCVAWDPKIAIFYRLGTHAGQSVKFTPPYKPHLLSGRVGHFITEKRLPHHKPLRRQVLAVAEGHGVNARAKSGLQR